MKRLREVTRPKRKGKTSSGLKLKRPTDEQVRKRDPEILEKIHGE
ncbi:hypothetical protein PC116_g30394 [Phytophthora cactorum]|nr:hypothetical protein PC116_g30394 [Phytophthora cactorum]